MRSDSPLLPFPDLLAPYPMLDKVCYNTDHLLKSSRQRALQSKLVNLGDIVIQTAGLMTGVSGSNMLVVSEMKEENCEE